MPGPQRRFLAAACAFFVVSLYVKARQLLLTNEYHDAIPASGWRQRAFDLWYSIVYSRNEALLFLALIVVAVLAAKMWPRPGRPQRVLFSILTWLLPVLSVTEVLGLSYYATYQTPFPGTDLVFARWVRELALSVGMFSAERILLGLALTLVAYLTARWMARRADWPVATAVAGLLAAGAVVIATCGFLAPRPVLPGSLIEPHPVVWLFVGSRPSFERLPPEELVAPLGPVTPRFTADRTPRNVIVVLLESTPARAVFPYADTPAGRRLFQVAGADTTVFDHVFSPAPESAHAFIALMTGDRPWGDEASTAERPSLSEVLHDHGFRTETYVNADSNVGGFGRFKHRGVDRFLDSATWPGQEEYRQLLWGRDDRIVFDEVKRFLERQTPGSQPFFLVAVTNNPHIPYDIGKLTGTPQPDDPKQAHAALVAYDLDLVADLYEQMRASDVARQTVVLVVGDHGEAFNEHTDNIVHSKNLYAENVHVPMFLLAPGRLGLPAHIAQLGSLQDLRATILDLLNIDASPGHGMSLLDSAPDRLIFSATSYGPGQMALRDSRYTFVLWPTTGRHALYDRQLDPGERKDISSERPEITSKFLERLSTTLGNARQP